MRNDLIENPLPSSPDAERAILGSIILNVALMTQAARDLRVEWFYVQSHQKIFLAMLALYESGLDISPLQITEELKQRGEAESVGGMAYISGLTFGLPHFSNINSYASVVKEKARLRWLMNFGREIVGQSLESDAASEDIAKHFDERMATFRERSDIAPRGAHTIGKLVDPQLERFERFHHNIVDAVPTGFDILDENLTGGGLVRSQFIVLAARPSLGKTALALDIAANNAAQGKCVYFASIEMSKEVLLDRLFSVSSGVERWKIQPGLYSTDLEKLKQTAPELKEWGLVIDDHARSVPQMNAACRDIIRQRPLDLIVIDYLQLMDTQKGGTRNDQVGANSRALTHLAKEYNCPVLCLSQLDRKCEQRPNGEPELIDLRDSGEIEQDARTVFFLFGDKGEEDLSSNIPSPIWREITLKCAKQGEGKLFRTQMPFHTKLVTFRTIKELVGSNRQEAQEYNF